ncbi:MAG: SdrD B-like domain-containing protein, partial [Actinomycetes bacterium]
MRTHERDAQVGCTAGRSRVRHPLAGAVTGGALLALAVIGVQQLLHDHLEEAVPLPPLLHWLRDGLLAVPIGVLAVLLARQVDRRHGALAGALAGSGLFAVASVPAGEVHGWLFQAGHVDMSFLQHARSDGMVVWLVALVCLCLAAADRGLWQAARTAWDAAPESPRAPVGRRRVAVVAAASLAFPALPVAGLVAPAAAAAGASCAVTRSYDVAAIDLDVPYNRWGQRDDDGMMYVLQQDKAAVKNWDVPLNQVRTGDGTYAPGVDPAAGRRLRPRPLVLRANEGDCVVVTLTNELNPRSHGGTLANPRVSMHISGAAYDVQTSDGSAVGFNDDSTVAIGQSITYTWIAPEEGVYLFRDHAAIAGSEADGGSTVHGMFGALAVEPPGSTWTDPVTGARLDSATPYQDPVTRAQSGDLYIDADIHTPSGSFRESVQLAHDEIPGIGFGFNYGSEPGPSREAGGLCPDCVGEETSLSSWTYGDPALVKLASGLGPWPPTPGSTAVEDCGLPTSCWVSNVTHAYRWDATKIRYGLAGVKETHVFHMHAHQWLMEPNDTGASGGRPRPGAMPESTTVDSQTFGPGDMFTADLLFGAGSNPGTVGDSIFHCHLYPHFAEGFWALFRVHDVLEDGSGTTPDGIGVRRLAPLPGGWQPPAPTADNPGYPRFIPGQVGWRAPQPYGGVSNPGAPGTPADRIVAGRALDQSVLDATQRIHNTSTRVDEVQQVTTTSAPRDEVQTVDVAADGGTFTLQSGATGTPTSPIAYDAGAQALQDALAVVGVTTVVTKSGTGNSWSVTFPGGTDVPQLVADGALLTDSVTGLAGSVTVATATEGADGGTFTLRPGATGTPTAPVRYDATAQALQDALTAVGVQASVTKAATGNSWSLTFPGGVDVPELVADGTSLTSGAATVTTETQGADGGTFRLSFGGETTGALPFDATAGAVETALEALGTIEAVTVTGSGTSTDPWVVRLDVWNPVDSLVVTATDALTSGATTIQSDPLLTGDAAAARIAHQLMVERHVLRRAYDAGYDPRNPSASPTEPRPGAPMSDPCPSGAREVTYDVTVLQRDVVYNEAGWHDTQGRLLVLDKDVEAVLSGAKAPEPLFIRVAAGDCVNFNLTNGLPNWFGNDAFVRLTQTNMVGEHIHLVKFDVLGSDGSSNGWNYQQAAFSQLQREFNDAVVAGTRPCSRAAGCRLPLPADYSPSWTGLQSGQTIHERWYADYELRTVFTHDHHFPAVDQNRGLYGGLIVEPAGTDFRHPRTGEVLSPSASLCAAGASCVGAAAGAMMDVIGPLADDDFREFGLSFQDFVSLTRPGGNPRLASDVFNPPEAPEAYPDEDPGVMGINYRNAPFLLRDTKNGAWVDPAYRFSSTVFGDPRTPLLQAYAKDKVRIRLIGGSQEEQHVFALHGMRWRDEPDDPQSPLVNQRALGVSDALNFEIPEMDCGVDEDCRGDYLYSSTSVDATYLGMWGIMRVFGRGTQDLLPLPDNIPQAVRGTVNLNPTGEPPPMANKPGTPCDPSAPVRAFHVVATDGKITYNKAGDNDPYGLMYGLVEPGETAAQAAERVRSNPVPLVLRGNEGDCLEVRLTNAIDPNGRFATEHAPLGAADGDAKLPLEPPTGTRAGLRVSLHPQLVKYDVRGSDGATVGFNRDQTVAPGQSILYRWWADDVAPGELGATNLVDFGDLRGHRHHGLFAGLTIEPKNATYHDPSTGAQVRSGVTADIRVPGAPDFREFTAFFSDGMNLRDAAGAIIPSPNHDGEPMDAEDEGEKGFNYASEPFKHRLGVEPVTATQENPLDGAALSDVFSSKVHGDPSTPIFRAYAGDPVRMRVLQGSDKPRQHAFQQSGHAWRAQPDDPGSTLVGTQGGISVGKTLNLHLAGAGGPGAVPGDYLYGCAVAFHHRSGGLWGITRVYPQPAAASVFTPTSIPAVDDPRAPGNRPIMPLEQVSVSGSVYRDSNLNRERGSDEGGVGAVLVTLVKRGPGMDGALYTADDTVAELDRRATDSSGRVTFHAAPGVYDVEPVVPADWDATTPASVRVDASAENASGSAAFGMVQLADVTVHVYQDKNGNGLMVGGDGSREPGEVDLTDWSVTLTGAGVSRTGVTDGSGQVSFDGLRPGTYSATATAKPGWYNTHTVPWTFAVAENASLTGAAEVRLGYALKAGLSVQLFNDSNGNAARDAGESYLAGWQVAAEGGPPGVSVRATGTTDANGVVTFEDADPEVVGLRPGTYVISQTYQKDWSFGSARATTRTATQTGDTPDFSCADGRCTTVLVDDTTQVVTIGNRNPNSWVVAAPFNDVNNDGKRQDKESKLVGWTAELFAADGVTPVKPSGWTSNATVTGPNGQAVFYPLPPGFYRVRMLPPPPSPDPLVLDWTGTTPALVPVGVIAGETARTAFGFARLGTVGATVWHDHDSDGLYEEDVEEALANRNVRLYDHNGKTLLGKGVTDASGTFAFKVSPGVTYQLEVLLPDGSVATSPLGSNGTPVTRVKVTGPSGTTSENRYFGQYQQNDTTPPPNPTATPPGGTYSAAQSVSLASEDGATFRYTLDGSTPTATQGQLYDAPIAISTSRTLKAVALDGAGNVSGVTTEVYEITGGGTTTAAPAAPGRWEVLKGSVVSGTVANLSANDGTYLVTRSAKQGNKQVVEAYGSYTVPAGQRSVTALSVAYDGGASPGGFDRTLSLYNVS